MCEKLQGMPVGNQENEMRVEGPRISPGVENMFFSNFYIRSQLMAAKSKLIERISEIDIDGSVWEILTEKECTKRHKKFLTKKEMCTVICEEVGGHKMTYLFAIKGSNKPKNEEYQQELKWQEVYSVL